MHVCHRNIEYMEDRVSRSTTNLAGELFVAAELSRLDHLVTITFGQAKAIDLLVARQTSPDDIRTIDVKCSKKQRRDFSLGVKEPIDREKHFYVFCILGETGTSPKYYIVPSKTVREKHIHDHPRDTDSQRWMRIDAIDKPEYQDWSRLWSE